MKKALMMMFAFIMALGANLALASSRTDAMSADPNVVEDYDLIFTFPNKVLEYKNTSDFRLGSLTGGNATQDDWSGVLDGKHEAVGVVGLYLHRPMGILQNWNGKAYNAVLSTAFNDFGFDTFHGAVNGLDNGVINDPTPLFELFWGKSFSSLDLGVKVNYASNSQKNTIDNTTPADTRVYTDKVSALGLQAGVGLKNLGPFSQANFSAGIEIGSIDLEQTDTVTNTFAASLKNDSVNDINVNALLQHDMGENDNLRVFANAEFGTFGIKIADAGSPNGDSVAAKTTSDNINVGLGCNHKVNDGAGLVSAGLKLNVASAKDTASGVLNGVADTADFADLTEETRSSILIPAFLSTEAKVASWLTLRAGASYYLFGTGTRKDTYTGGSQELKNSVGGNVSFNTGFGINWKNWELDTVLDTNVLENNIGSVQPGRGLLFGGNTLTVASADLRYKF